ncbi:peptidase domain-containing ABC transporter [Clostridium beijerinckii]|uniref:peptidase domain-containing ABC transporter n=1 Tax=Clostridium beijerinckii TaxID=1520 RepID=UPI00222773EF|nr:peptidase domain-containing ABC transporter [Clostridium beijerinckii]UYZ35873.1 peptidase domain-containing ABC transporter [Clostridium beijerinckii]
MMNIFKRYVCIMQHDIKDCGCACLATISKQYGLKIPITKIRETAGTDKQGTSAFGIIKAAEQIGFTAKGVKVNNPNDIFSEFSLPAIAHVIIDGNLLHYVVIHKISQNELLIADPGRGIIKYKPEEFFKIWSGILILMAPTAQFKKGNETKGLFQRFFGLLIPQKRLLINIFFASILLTALGILPSFYFQTLMDTIIPGSLSKTLIEISLGVICVNIFKVLLDAFRTQLLIYLGQNINTKLMIGYYDHVVKLPMKFFATRETGEIISRFNDASKIRDAISGVALTMMIDTLMIIFGGVILFSENHLLFGITIIPVFLYLIIILAFNGVIERVNRITMEDNAKLTSYLVESLNGIETVKAFNGEKKINFEMEKRFTKLVRSIFKNGFISNMQGSIKTAVQSVFGTVILWIGAYEVIQGNMTIGQLLTFNALLTYFLDSIQRIINLQPTLQTAIVAADRLGEILDLELEKSVDEEKKVSPKQLNGKIEFNNVDFRYGTRQLVLKNICISIEPGEKIALVGESGSGKTTISKLLLNFYQCEKGEVLINRYNVKDINLEILRDRISYISQDMFFFSGSIKENLRFGSEKATFEEIVEACKKAQIHEYINSLPARYDTFLEENASNFSGGQKQRLAIARAILKKPDILIMDEATSNLDSITERAINKTINEFCDGISTIIIAHRLSTIMRCDKIYVMDKGEIIEVGNHDELIKQGGRYYNLWREQIPELANFSNLVVENNIVEYSQY